MIWIALLIVIVLILRNISTSHISAARSNLPSKITPRVCGAGDGFCGNTPTTVAGVPEPTQRIYNRGITCNMIKVGVKTVPSIPSLPVHITLPIAPQPPPLKIIQPVSRPVSSGGTSAPPCGYSSCGLARLLRVE